MTRKHVGKPQVRQRIFGIELDSKLKFLSRRATPTLALVQITGQAEPTCPFLSRGTAFVDYDNDGWKDLTVRGPVNEVTPSDKAEWQRSRKPR